MNHQDTTAPTAQAAHAQLIERHSAAYNALSKAIDDHEDDPHHPAVGAPQLTPMKTLYWNFARIAASRSRKLVRRLSIS